MSCQGLRAEKGMGRRTGAGVDDRGRMRSAAAGSEASGSEEHESRQAIANCRAAGGLFSFNLINRATAGLPTSATMGGQR